MEIISFQSEGQLLQGAFYPGAPGENATMNGSKIQAPPVVILCHGAFEDRENWAAYGERLANQGFPAFAFDFVGHGSSGGQRGLVDMRCWAYNIRDAMNALSERGHRRFALVGWGSGGSASLLAAAHDKRLACAAVLAAPVQIMPPLNERVAFTLASGASKVWQAVKKRPLTFSRAEAYGAMRFAVDDQVDADYKANPRLRETLQAVPIPGSLDNVWVDITRAVVKIKIPVLIVHGAKDAVVPLKQSEKLNTLLTGVKKLYLVEDSGHALHLDQKKDEVYIAVARWIKHYLS